MLAEAVGGAGQLLCRKDLLLWSSSGSQFLGALRDALGPNHVLQLGKLSLLGYLESELVRVKRSFLWHLLLWLSSEIWKV